MAADVPRWRRYLRLFGTDVAADVDDEFRFHVEAKARELMEQGVPPKAAYAQAAQRFGDMAAMRSLCEKFGKETARQMRWKDKLTAWTQDCRYGWRSLRQQKAFTAVAVITLAAGIAGASSLFSFLHSWVIQPLTFEDPDRLAFVRSFNTSRGREIGVSLPDYDDIRRRARTFESLSAWSYASYTLSNGQEPERVSAVEVSGGFFEMLGVRPALGRTFSAEESIFGRHHVAIVSHGFWKARYGGKPGIVGSGILLDGESYTIVGVLPERFHFTLAGYSNVWTPLARSPEQASRRQARFTQLIGRLAPGATFEQAHQELRGIAADLARRYPDTNLDVGSFSMPLAEEVGRHVGKQILFVVFGITIGLLLIACSNVANLLLVRAVGRRRQAAIQMSIGATRARLMNQVLAETLIVFSIAAAIGMVGAWRLTEWVCNSIPFENRGFLPNYGVASMDWPVFAFAFGVALITGLVFGLAPAVEQARAEITSVLKESGSAASHGAPRRRVRAGLVVSQVAIAMVLLCSNGLLMRAFRGMWDVPPGFDPHGVMSFQLALDRARHPDATSRRALFDRILESVGQVPQPGRPALARYVPFGEDSGRTQFRVEGVTPDDPRRLPSAQFNVVSPEFFHVMKTPILSGRPFQARDSADATPVVIVTEGLVRRYLGSGNPIGKRLILNTTPQKTSVEIVGVAGEIRYDADTPAGDPQIYRPFAQSPATDAFVLLRTESEPSALLSAIRHKVTEVDRLQPVFNAKTMDDRINMRFAPYYIVDRLLFGFSTIALLLAAVGVYGVVAFSVSHRTREIGIRAAIGADRRSLLLLILRQGLHLLVIAVLPGALAAIGVASLLRSVIPEAVAVPLAPTLLFTAAVLASAVMLATWIPARRAAAIDPVRAIRCE